MRNPMSDRQGEESDEMEGNGCTDMLLSTIDWTGGMEEQVAGVEKG